MRSGIYALVNLDGGPLAASDVARLGLATTTAPIAACGCDAVEPDAVHVAADPDRMTIVAGFLDEPGALAESLKMPGERSVIVLARAALARYGAEAARAMRGEWSLLDWTAGGGDLILMSSLGQRDPVLYACSGSMVAVAPDLDLLAQLPWVDRDIDTAGLFFALGRHRVRRAKGDRTILADVSRLEAGATVRLGRSGRTTLRIDPFVPVAPFHGSFDEAMEEAEYLLRGIIRRTLSRTPAAACLLSGGLDSSLVALLAADERKVGQPLICLSSAAPDASGLSDETAFARIVADHLDLTMECVAPPDFPAIYRHTEEDMKGADGPFISVRHYLYEALYARAAQLRLPLVLDGALGELTITAGMPVTTTRYRLRRLAKILLRRTDAVGVAHSPFHVRLAPHRLAAMPEVLADALRAAPPELAVLSPRRRWGYLPGAEKFLQGSNNFRQERVRTAFPFRNLRLLELFASFPARFAQHDGVMRAPVRHLMKGRLPDSIRLRPSSLPFSPDYNQRLQRQAGAARARIAAFRADSIDDWLDLDWLDSKLQDFSARGPASIMDAFEVQGTALAAEYLLWWQSRS